MRRLLEARSKHTRRPMLLALVFGVFLVLVGITASGLTAVISSNLTAVIVNATVERDASLAELFVNENLNRADVGGSQDAARAALIGTKLSSLTHDDGILRAELRSVDGLVLFSSDSTSIGARPALLREMRRAVDGHPGASLVSTANLDDLAGSPLDATDVVREYLPVVDEANRTVAVMALWRDAAPILAEVGRTQREVVVLVVAASLVLAAVLFLVFRAAHVRIGRQHAQLVEASRRDALTGMLNHGSIVARLEAALEQQRAASGSLALAVVDVDNFRLLNDTHGHPAGDEVLRRVADLLTAALTGASDASAEVGRYGPDEFVLFWPHATTSQAEAASLRIRSSLANVSVRFGESERLPVTVSIGLAEFPTHAGSLADLLSAATVALQEAKASGGDAVRSPQPKEESATSGSFDVLQGLVIAVDTKDRYTKRHSEDVARYAVFLARCLGLDEETLTTVRISGLLHDVGKIGIPDALLRRPGRLSAQEFDTFKQHVALGDAIVRDIPNLDRVREGIRHHHERWDGRGYLDGLEGEAIPIIGRIMAVADAFSAMTTTRPYRKALPVEEALKRLGDAAGSQLQEELVAVFIKGIETEADAPLPGAESSLIWLPQARVA